MLRKGTAKPGRDREKLYSWGFVGPAVAYMGIFAVYPIVYNFILAFKNMSAKRMLNSAFVGLQTAQTVFNKGVVWTALGNTIYFTVCSILFQITIGFAFALLFSKKFSLAQPLRGFMLVGWMMPMTVIGILFKFMFQTDVGIVNHLLRAVGLSPVSWLTEARNAMWAVIIANIWVGIPFDMALLTMGLSGIGREVHESSTLDGANKWQDFLYITLPMLKGTLLSILALGVVYTFKVFDLVIVMTQGGPVSATEMMSTYAYKLAFHEFNFSQGAVVSCLMFLVLFAAGLGYLRTVREDEVMA